MKDKTDAGLLRSVYLAILENQTEDYQIKLTEFVNMQQELKEQEIKEEIRQRIIKWTPFINRNKTLMCREQVLSLIDDLSLELECEHCAGISQKS